MPRPNSRAIVIVFARAPRPGASKTRLIPALGAEGAAALHARLLKRTLATAREAAPGRVELHGAPADDDFLRLCAARYGADLVAQCEGDLGERMRRAVESTLARGETPIVIGSDCPVLNARHLREAARTLATHDAVLAPTEDGGYALIGLARCDAALFADMRWSTAAVMDETRARLAALGWRWHELETLWDVDRPEDFERLRESGLLDIATPAMRQG